MLGSPKVYSQVICMNMKKPLEVPVIEEYNSFLATTLSKKSTPGDGTFACGTKGEKD